MSGMKRRSTQFDAAGRLAGGLVVLAAVQSVLGIAFPDGYRDNAFVLSAWRANDIVTAVVAVPLMITAFVWARRGEWRGRLVVFGVLAYMLYNYAFYLFGAAFNVFFPLYVALLAGSIAAIVLGAPRLVAETSIAPSPRLRRWVGGYMWFVAVSLSAIYSIQWGTFLLRGELPPIVTLTGHPTSVVFALDLALLVPALALGASWLRRGLPCGYVAAVALNIKGGLYTLVLAVGSRIAVSSGYPSAAAETPLWSALTVCSFASAVLLLRRGATISAGESSGHISPGADSYA